MRYRYTRPLLAALAALLLAPAGFAQEGTVEERSFSSEDFPRDYLLYVPSTYDASRPLPLVLNFHGFRLPDLREPALDHMDVQTQMNAVAEASGFLVAYPTGRGVETLTTEEFGRGWNVPGPYEAEHDDVLFAAQIIDHVAAAYAVDASRVYAAGWGNGGEQALRLACALSDRIAAVASVAGPMSEALLDTCEATRPVSTLLIHGTADPVFPADGVPDVYPAADATPAYWAGRNGCAAVPTETPLADTDPNDGSTATLLDYPGCEGAAEVQYVRIDGGGHGWPGNSPDQDGLGSTNRDLDGSAAVWAFLARNPHPEPPAYAAPLFDPAETRSSVLVDVPSFTEGVVFDAEGNAYFSEIGRDIITKWTGLLDSGDAPLDTTRWGDGLQGPNGHKILPDGTHLVCDRLRRAIVRLSPEGDILGVAADNYEGNPLFNPNDIVLDDVNGGFYFTDSGDPDSDVGGDGAVYYVDANGDIELVANALNFANGLALDTERRRLYVGESFGDIVSVAIQDDGTYGPPEFFATLSGSDGMALDQATGRLYATTFQAGIVAVFAPSGVRLADYEVDVAGTTNLVFVETEQGRSIYVVGGLSFPISASRGALTRLDLFSSPVDAEDDAPVSAGPTLDAAYPNPFTERTTVRFHLEEPADIRLDAYDLLGRHVATLARGVHAAGPHAVAFDGARLASGVYVLRLQAAGTAQHRTVTLVK